MENEARLLPTAGFDLRGPREFTVKPILPQSEITIILRSRDSRDAQLIARHIFKLRPDQMQIARSGGGGGVHIRTPRKLIDDTFN